MATRDVIFVDLDNLNVLIRSNDRFVSALSFYDSLERLATVLGSFPVGYTVHLCMKPLAPGEGDTVIDQLSLSGLPFTVCSAELKKAVSFFKGLHGVGDIFIHNWVHNYISVARVKTFSSVVYYGNRVALIEVKSGLVDKFTLFENQRDFADKIVDDSSICGDIGLVDIAGICARYTELSSISKANLTTLAPLIECYKNTLRVSIEDLPFFDSIVSASPTVTSDSEEEKETAEEIAEEDSVTKEKDTKPEPEGFAVEELVKEIDSISADGKFDSSPVKVKSSVLTKALMVASFLACFLLGGSIGVVNSANTVSKPDSYYEDVDNRIKYMQSIVQVYTAGPDRGKDIVNALKYCQNSELNISIVGFEFSDSDYIVRCAAASEDAKDSYIAYINEEYFSLEDNDLGDVQVGDTTLKQFSIRFS